MRHLMTMTAVVAALSLAPATLAVTLDWDPDAVTADVQGGNGDWDTSTANWTADDGANHTTWSNANPDLAVFGDGPVATGGTVDVTEPITAQKIDLYEPYTIQGSTLTLVGDGSGGNTAIQARPGSGPHEIDSDITVNVDQQWTLQGGGNLEVSGDVSGSGGIRKNGVATLTLSGDNSGLSGTVTLGQGTVALDSNTALGTGTLSFRGASGGIESLSTDRTINNPLDLFIGAGQTQRNFFRGNFDMTFTQTLPLRGGIRPNAWNPIVQNDIVVDFQGGVAYLNGEPKSLIKDGTGTLALGSAANSIDYTGTTEVNEGTLLVNGTTADQQNYTVGDAGNGTSATLGGTGTINLAAGASVDVLAGLGTIAPGNGPGDIGTLAIDGPVNLNGTLLAEVDVINDEADLLDVLDALALGGTSELSLSLVNDPLDPLISYTLAGYGTLSGTFATDNVPVTHVIDYGTALDPVIRLVPAPTGGAIPEPALLGVLGLAALAVVRRR